jgi:amidase
MIKSRMDPCLEPAHKLAARLRERGLTAVELLERYRSRVERLNPALNAIIATDFDAARERAARADADAARGQWWGPLHGLPVTIKDTFEFAGLPTVAGAPALKGHRPARSAPAVQRLVDAGAVVFGKTNVPMYAGDVQTHNAVFGVTNSPWDAKRTPGGSSGGAAAAVAAGLAALELGSDVAGSIRTPAHFCGIYGHKPSSGLVPTRGHIPGPPGTASESDLLAAVPLARSAEDLALALRVLAGAELPAPRRARLSDYRVALWLDDPYCPVDAALKPALDGAVEHLRRAGAQVSTDRPPFALEQLHALYFQLLGAIFAAGIPTKLYRRAWLVGTLASWFGRDKPDTLPGFLRAVSRSHRDWLVAHEKRERLRLKFEEFFASFDVLLMPVARIAAPAHNNQGSPYTRRIAVNGRDEPYATQFTWIGPATLAGLPATAAPIGQTADGLPVGIQVVGAHRQDLTTIDFARQLTALAGGFRAPPV